MRVSSSVLAACLASLASADFFISNTSVCMGTFIVQNCVHGVQVLSETHDLSGKQNATDYKCDHLVSAQDNNYIHNGTMGQWGSPGVTSAGGICSSGELKFVQDGQGGYSVNDKNDQHVGSCSQDNTTVSRNCNEWVGMLYFASSYKCTSSICD